MNLKYNLINKHTEQYIYFLSLNVNIFHEVFKVYFQSSTIAEDIVDTNVMDYCKAFTLCLLSRGIKVLNLNTY